MRAIAEDSAQFISTMNGEGKIDTQILRKIGDEYQQLATQVEAEGFSVEGDDDMGRMQDFCATMEAMAHEHHDTIDIGESIEDAQVPDAVLQRLRNQFGSKN